MAVLTTPGPARFHTPPQAFPDRLALDDPVSLACFAPIVGQSEQVTWTRAPCRLVVAWRPLARHQRRFLRMHGEAQTGEALRQDFHHPAGIGFALTANDTILGTATQKTSALHPGVDGLDTPCVQDMRQAYMGEHPCGVPLSGCLSAPASSTPACRHLPLSLRMPPSLTLCWIHSRRGLQSTWSNEHTS